MSGLTTSIELGEEVRAAQRKGQPLVALESALITHGLPRPTNLETAQHLEEVVRAEGGTPATVALVNGRVRVGLFAGELETLTALDDAIKVSSRDLGPVIAANRSGGTTVAATMRIAAFCGIRVFATGGSGGVHRGSQWDVSADLFEMARQPVLVVCAGAKSILDLPATLERLESLSVPVLGYQTDEFPAFFTPQSDLKLNARVDSPEEAAEVSRRHWELGGQGLLLAAPIPAESALSRKDVEDWIETAQRECDETGIHGPAVTPYLLQRIAELSEGKSLAANLALLENNAHVAAQVAKHLKPRSDPAAGLLPRSA